MGIRNKDNGGEKGREKGKEKSRGRNREKENPNMKADQNILVLTYFFVGLFIALVLYFAVFLTVKKDDVINNAYNARLDSFSDRIVRGKIFGSGYEVIARTNVSEDGSEQREYPYGTLFSHVAGYTGKGKTGLEALGNFYMLSSHVNLLEQVYHELTGQKNTGDDIVTTLNVEMQQAAYDALGDRRGAVIAMEPDTGKILAMVSKPDFNPNTIVADWEDIVAETNTSGQLLNRATQGLYPPGSTFKILTALEYMRENPDTYEAFQYDCGGLLQEEEYTIQCYHKEAHGQVDFTGSFANSCNGAFAKMGLSLDAGKFHQLADGLLFNTTLPISLPYSKSTFSMNAGADTWEVLQTSIGQGMTQMTPMHNLMITAAIANGGTLMKPYLIDRVETAAGQRVKKFMPSAYGSLMSAQEAEKLAELMRHVVTEGTGSALRDASYTAAGKTGSAEFETGKETHAWFTGFAPAESPKIAVCVIVEEGGSGGKAAAPIARKVMDVYFSQQESES